MDSRLEHMPAESLQGRPRSRDLLLGIPAVLAGLLVIFVALRLQSTSRSQLLESYRVDGERELKAKHFEASRICYERLALLGDDNPEVLYNTVLLRDALGEPGRAMAMLQKLAPEDRKGYSQAHLLLATILLKQPKRTPRMLAVIETHLRFHLKDKPSSVMGLAGLGQLLAATGRSREALPLLKSVVNARPDLSITLARASTAEGETAQARRWATGASRYYKEQFDTNPDDRLATLKWLEAELFLGNYTESVAILEKALARKDDRDLRIAMAAVYATWLESLNRESAPNEEYLTLLEKGLKYDPMNQPLLGHLATVMKAGGPQADRGRAYLMSLLTEGKASATAHFLLGADAWERGRKDESLDHWELAYRLSPETAVIANNLAWVLAFGNQPDRPRALSVINQAIARWPGMGLLKGTRGHIFVALERWKEAIPDLETSLQASPKDPKLHSALAKAYESQKMPEIAARHRELATESPHAGATAK
jgi:tetratricopeptide (TPR) repeat protein